MTDITAIRAAAARLAGHALRTPLLESPFLNDIAGRRVLVKAECLQRTGSFKFRGAWSALTVLPDGTRGVLAYSSGNHAQGVALAGKLLGIPTVIVMPADAPALKLANTRALGGEDRETIGAALAEDRGLILVRPYDDPMVIAGQGTVGLEIAEQARDAGIDAADVVVCCGGGGLTAGIALALEAEAPQMRVRTAEPEGFDDVARSLRAGSRQTNAAMSGSICDAIVTPSPGEITFPIMRRLCGPGLVVSDREALHAVGLAALRLKILAEPGGAVSLAAALWRGDALRDGPVIAVVTGGNADPETVSRALALI
jgi:threonine dehydratase